MEDTRVHGENPILIIGGGVAGITAALDLANAGQVVHVVEQNGHLGGQVSRLDKLYPTDHCAFCPLWTEIKKCRDHRHITVHTSAYVRELRQEGNHRKATIVRRPPFIDEGKCVFCGRCVRTCPVEEELGDLGDHGPSSHALSITWDHAYPPSYAINEEVCTTCGLCQEVCPMGAIDLNRAEEETVLTVDEVIWATGFREADLSGLEEFGSGTHPDIMRSLEFEAWISEAGPNRGKIRKRSNLTTPRNIAFVQCAGARDKRMFSYCSTVCCMHALKQARWVKKRSPQTRCAIFYTDMRAVGTNYYEYARRAMEEADLELIRGRPGLILPLRGEEGIGIRYENTTTQGVAIRRFDMVVLNGALEPWLRQGDPERRATPLLDNHGFLSREGNGASSIACGFSVEPVDVIESVIQASSAALKAIQKHKTER